MAWRCGPLTAHLASTAAGTRLTGRFPHRLRRVDPGLPAPCRRARRERGEAARDAHVRQRGWCFPVSNQTLSRAGPDLLILIVRACLPPSPYSDSDLIYAQVMPPARGRSWPPRSRQPRVGRTASAPPEPCSYPVHTLPCTEMISLAPRAGPSFRLLLYIKLLLVHMSRLCTIYYIQWFRRRWRLVIGVVSVCWTVCFDDLAKEGQERCSYFSQKSCRIRGECRTWYLGRWTWRGHGHWLE